MPSDPNVVARANRLREPLQALAEQFRQEVSARFAADTPDDPGTPSMAAYYQAVNAIKFLGDQNDLLALQHLSWTLANVFLERAHWLAAPDAETTRH